MSKFFLLRLVTDQYIFILDSMELARGKRKKFLYPMMMTILLMKTLILPIMFKSMAIMTSISVLMSLFSLIISSIIGFTKQALYHIRPSYKVFHIGAGTKGIELPPDIEPYHYGDAGIEEHDAGIGEYPGLLEQETLY